MTARYALYLAPDPASALWRFGSAVIGYDAESGKEPPPPDLAGFDASRWRALTETPRRYGFHGTLKAPFRLKAGRDMGDLLCAVAALACAHEPFELPALQARALGAFIALIPPSPVPALDDLAAAAVRGLDGLRAPLSPAERTRRQPERLTPRQRALLDTYGYPYVLEAFRFHMTLTGSLPEAEQAHALAALAAAFAASGARAPVTISDVAVFAQDSPAARFRLMARVPLGGGAAAVP